MGIALTHVRGSIARQNPPTSPEPALPIYVLAQKHGLRLEALQPHALFWGTRRLQRTSKISPISCEAHLSMNSGSTTKGFGLFLRQIFLNLESLVLRS